MRRWISLGLVALAMTVAACGGGKSNTASSTAPGSSSPSVSSSSQSDVLFEDSFSSNANSWNEKSNDPDYSAAVAGGGYNVKVTTDTTVNLESTSAPKGDSVSVEATYKSNQVDPQNSIIGVLCRRSDKGDTFYYGQITTDGYWGIFKRVNGSSTPLKTAPATANPAIKGGSGATNVVRLDCDGAAGSPVTLTLTVNGTKIDQVTESAPLDAGTFGLRITGPGTDVTVTHVVVRKLSGYSDQSAASDSYGQPVLKVDFAQNSSVGTPFVGGSSSDVDWRIENEQMRMVAKTSDFLGYQQISCSVKVSSNACDTLQNMSWDVSVEVDATQNGGAQSTDAGGFGLGCRAAMGASDTPPLYGMLSGYAFLVAGDGSFLIDRVDGGQQQTAVKSGKASSFKPGQTNHLRADCIGKGTPRLAFYVNGQKVADVTDTSDPNGSTTFTPHVGLVVASNTQPGLDVSFDNFVLRQ